MEWEREGEVEYRIGSKGEGREEREDIQGNKRGEKREIGERRETRK